MKKFILIAALISTTGLATLLTSCTKDNSVKPSTASTKTVYDQDPKNLGSGDGTPPEPPTPGH